MCVRGVWRPNRTAIYWPPTLMAISVVSFLFSWCSTGGPGAHSAGCGLSLPHLVTNGSGLQTHWLPVYTELYNSSIALSISPHNLPLEMCHFRCLWNGMFDCHRADITVMQFTGHFLPVHQSMTVPRDFTLSHIVSQACQLRFQFCKDAHLHS